MFYQYQHFGVSEYFCKEYGKDFNFPRHIHRSFELITVTSGHMDVCVGQNNYRLSAGDAVLIFPNQLHSLESSQSEHMLIIFSPNIVNTYYSRSIGIQPKSNKFSVTPHLMSQIESLDEGCSAVKKKAVLYSVCALFDESAEYEKRESSENDLLSRIFNYIDQNFEKDSSLEALSTALGYSCSYLSRYFKDTTAMPYNSFVNKYKISKACYMLTNTDKTILECSLDSGYSSLRSFNRNFKIHVGTTPKEYRETTRPKNKAISS